MNGPAVRSVVVSTDGGSRGNPGPAAIGAVVCDADDSDAPPLVEVSEAIGHGTNNEAEYEAIIAGLEAARALGAVEVHLRSDSQLAINQLNGSYRVKKQELRPLWRRARMLLGEFETAKVEHVRREFNTEADALVNAALDAG